MVGNAIKKNILTLLIIYSLLKTTLALGNIIMTFH